MSLARLVGIDVPPVRVIDTQEFRNLPKGIGTLKGQALAIEHFDRLPDGGAIHIKGAFCACCPKKRLKLDGENIQIYRIRSVSYKKRTRNATRCRRSENETSHFEFFMHEG